MQLRIKVVKGECLEIDGGWGEMEGGVELEAEEPLGTLGL